MLISRNTCLVGVLVLTAWTAWAQTTSPATAPAKQKAVECPPPVKFRSVSIHARDTVYAHLDGYTKEGFSMRGATLSSVMEYVFSTKRIEGLPDWAKTERYDVIAEIDPKDCCRWTNETTQEKSLAVQGFLQEKLKLKWHKETRMVGGFDLVVGKKGPKFAPAKTDAKLPDWSDEAIHSGRYLPQLNGIPITMEELAALLSATAEVGHPVVDKTGLAGRYTLYIQYQPPQVNDSRIMEADGTPVQSHALTIFDDLEVLGLELKGTKVPVDVLVIDKIERPSEN